jgi:hypothetical protein
MQYDARLRNRNLVAKEDVMAFSLDGIRLDGCKFGPRSERDFHTVFTNVDVPPRIDLRDYCSPVEDQGKLGSCTANAVVGALEYYLKRAYGRTVEMSRMFVYYNSRRLVGRAHLDDGVQIREAMASVLAYGACTEALWPYDPTAYAKEPPPVAYAEAMKYEGIQYARLEKGVPILQALAQGFPVVFGGSFPRCCYDELEDGWVMPQPTLEQYLEKLKEGGGHAMLIVGYDKLDQMYIVRNSWGEKWAQDGYCMMPFGVAEMCSEPDEFWIVSKLEGTPAFKLIRPARELSISPTPSRVPEMRTGSMAAAAAKLRDEIRSGLKRDISRSSARIEDLLSREPGKPSRQGDD